MLLSKEYKIKSNHNERILQFGEGNFLRAFADWIIHKMNSAGKFDGSVVVIQPIEQGLIAKLNEQDGLYTLYLQGIKNDQVVSEHEIVSSISRGINPYENFESYLETATNKDMRFIISNTTEAGIYYEPTDNFQSHIQKSFPGKLTKWLYHRFTYFNGAADKGMILFPCELINRNGDKLKEIILKHATLWKLGEDFITWVTEHNYFCNTLVDRIVPGYPKDRIDEITKELGYEDQLVVEGEYFHLWVIEAPKWIEKEFPASSIGLNVKFVDDMTPYRTRKVRILNGTHTSLVPVAYLYGLRTVRESIEDQVIGSFIKEALFEEIIPTLTLPKEELDSFANSVMERFRNPYINHYLISIALNSISKFKTRVLPSLLTYTKEKKQLPHKLVFSLAALICFYKGEVNGEVIPLKDNQDILDAFNHLWHVDNSSHETIVSTILRSESYWGTDLTQIIGLEEMVLHYVKMIVEKGMKTAIYEVLK